MCVPHGSPSLPSSRPRLHVPLRLRQLLTGPLRFFSCPVSSPEGLHCPRGSFIHAPFCRFHLREKLGLDIIPSTIPSAGFGLFTLSARAKGDHLVEYMGEVLSGAEVESRYPKGDVGVYCLRISSDSFIDSALFRGVGSFANASKGNNKPNARFVCNPADSSARLVATRFIASGAEVFISYGQQY